MLENIESNHDDDYSREASWNLWSTTLKILAAAGTFAAGYLGFSALSAFVAENGVGAASDTEGIEDGLSNRPQVGFSSRRRLLSTPKNITVKNPVPDLQFEASREDRYFIDGADVFDGNILGIGVFVDGNMPLPNWLFFDSVIGQHDALGFAYNFVLKGSKAYVAGNSNGFLILDATNPSSIQLSGSYNLPGNAYMVSVQGDLACVVSGTFGLKTFNVSDPENIRLLGTYDTLGVAYDVTLEGNLAYLADGPSGIEVLDVSSPENIISLGVYDTPGSARYVTLKNTIAYVSDAGSGLKILDVSNPASISLLGSHPEGSIGGIALQDNLAYVARQTAGLLILDVSNPASISVVGSHNTPGSATGVFVERGVAYVADGSSGIVALDIKNPANVLSLGIYYTPGISRGIHFENSLAYVADSDAGFRILDISQGNLLGTATSVLVGEEYALEVIGYGENDSLASNSFTLTVNQLPRQKVNKLSDQSIFPGKALSLSLDSDALFQDPDASNLMLSVDLSGFFTLNSLTITALPTLRGGEEGVTNTRAVTLHGDYAYTSDFIKGVKIFDISDPSSVSMLGNYNTPGSTLAVVLESDQAYVADGSTGLLILDVANPSSISLLGSYGTSGAFYDLVLSGGVAYVADFDDGLHILDVSDPLNISLLGSYTTSGNARSVVKRDSLVYVADGGNGLVILDASNPASISFLGGYNTPGSAYDLFLKDKLAYVADGLSGLIVLDVSNPSNVRLVGTYDTPHQATAVWVQGGLACIADTDSGLQVLDVSNPVSVRFLGSYDTPGRAFDVLVKDSLAYVADDSSGLLILDLTTWQLTANPTEADVGNHEIVITATDELGGSVSDSFILRVEGPPNFNGTLPDQSVLVGDAYYYFIPQGLVTDPNNDVIAFDAHLQGGGALPAWLAFNPFSATFAGTPNEAGDYVIEVTATDNIAGSDARSFTLISRFKPQVSKPVVDPAPWREGRSFSFTIPADAFVDLNGNALSFTASLENGDPLPSWLSFDAGTRTFSGEPPESSATNFRVFVTATDSETGEQVSQSFLLAVTPNQPPVVSNPISTQRAIATQRFVFAISESTFSDPNNDPLTYRAVGLPKWLSFNPDTRVLSGKPSRSDTDTYGEKEHSIQIIASDGERSAATSFTLSVEGESHWELAILYGSPIIAAIGLAFAAYMGQAVVLNRKNREKYEKLEERLVAGEWGQEYEIDCDPEDIHSIKVKPKKIRQGGIKDKLCFFKSARQVNPNGNLPEWLAYCPTSNRLKVIAPGPSEADSDQWTVQVKNKAGVLLWSKKLIVDSGMNASLGSLEAGADVELLPAGDASEALRM